MSAVSVTVTAAPTRRYGVLITMGQEERGTWHTITAASMGEALRGIRTGAMRETAQVTLPSGELRVGAIEYLGLVSH